MPSKAELHAAKEALAKELAAYRARRAAGAVDESEALGIQSAWRTRLRGVLDLGVALGADDAPERGDLLWALDDLRTAQMLCDLDEIAGRIEAALDKDGASPHGSAAR